MKKYIVINKATRQIVWEGTVEEARLVLLNPWLSESNWQSYATILGNEVYGKL